MIDVRPYIGREYDDPHVCIQAVQDVFVDWHGGPQGLPVEAFYRWLLDNTHEVEHAMTGDFVAFKTAEWHIGLMVSDTDFIHCWRGGSTLVSPLARRYFQAIQRGVFRLNQDAHL